jgi:mono/diheme cytochrome c family protein
MNSKMAKSFTFGVLSAGVVPALCLLLSVKLGVLPVQADTTPSRLEAAVLGAALHATVARHAPSGRNPLPASEKTLIEGATLYRQMCSACHSLSRESDNSFGASFYPPAPNLPLRGTSYSDTEMFWIVKHGIRNTAMPAWRKLLSDDEIWQIVTLIRDFSALPDSVTAALRGHHP